MRYELIGQNDNNENIYARIDDDGLCRVTCAEDDRDYLAWLDETKTK